VITSERAALLAVLQDHLGYTFQSLALLDQALTHRSYVHEAAGSYTDYERLEFLGDAVLGCIISAYVYTARPTAPEGQLSQLRAGLVNQPALANLARQLDLGRFLRLGRGEDQHGGRNKASILAAAFEAMVAAMYLGGGRLITQKVLERYFVPAIEQCTSVMPVRDYKGVLQTQSLSVFGCPPTYRVVREEGPAHQKTFHVQLTLNQAYQCVGIGHSKKAAEQHAAQQLLALLQQMHPRRTQPSRASS